jgi:hypothetical protein
MSQNDLLMLPSSFEKKISKLTISLFILIGGKWFNHYNLIDIDLCCSYECWHYDVTRMLNEQV